MGKKKKTRKHQREPNESSHSSDVDNTETNTVSGKICTHIVKSVCLSDVKKALKNSLPLGCCESCHNNKKDELEDGPRFTAVENQVVWMCLQCGHQGCGRYSDNQHALMHYRTPRSDVHALAVNTSTWEVWCYDCDDDVSVDSNKKLLECVNFIRRHNNESSRVPEQFVKLFEDPNKTTTQSPSYINGNNNISNSSNGIDQNMQENVDSNKKKGRNSPGAKNARPNNNNSVSVPRVKGLCNLGNTCFFNAILQNLSQSLLFSYVLEQHCPKSVVVTLPEINCSQLNKEGDDSPGKLGSLDLVLPESGPLTQSLFNFFREVHSTNSTSSRNNVINPSQILGQICKKAPQFRGSKQQDSHELLRHLIDGVRTEEIKRQKTAILKAFNLPDRVEPSTVDNEVRLKIRAYGRLANHTVIDHLFGGQLISTVLCKECHISSQVFEPFLDLSLPISEEKPLRPNWHRKLLNDEIEMDPPVKREEKRTSKYQHKKNRHQARKEAKRLRNRRGDKLWTLPRGDGKVSTDSTESSVKTGTDSTESSLKTGKDTASCDVSEQSDADIEDNVESESTTLNPIPARRQSLPCQSSNANEDELATSAHSVEMQELSPPAADSLASGENIPLVGMAVSDTSLSPTSPTEDINNKLRRLSLEDKDIEEVDTALPPAAASPEGDGGAIGGDSSAESERQRFRQDWVNRSLTTLMPRYQPTSLECSVLSCLNQFTAPELLTGNNKFGCENCTSLRQAKSKGDGKKPEPVYSIASKQLLIFSPPAILTLHLKRFQQVGHTLRKVSRHVTFPLLLDLAPFCTSVCVGLANVDNDQTSILYSLYGIVEHSGRLASGHYTAYVKVQPWEDPRERAIFLNRVPTGQYEIDHLVDQMVNSRNSTINKDSDMEPRNPPKEPKPGKWYYVSDSSVSEVTEDSVLQSQAYILFYERIY